MCLYLKNKNIKIAKRDIYVFKVIIWTKDDSCVSPYKGQKYNVNELMSVNINIHPVGDVNEYTNYLINKYKYSLYTSTGFYSYSPYIKYDIWDKDAIAMIYLGDSALNTNTYLLPVNLGIFKIPKGSKYVLKDGIYMYLTI